MRSKFEEKIAAQLREADVAFEYEETVLVYPKKVRSARCKECESKEVIQFHRYTPDFEVFPGLPDAYFIEAKGIFSPSDRNKMLLVRENYPHCEFRMIFQRDNKIPIRGPKKKKPTSYTEWAKFHGFKYAVREVPKEWLR